jgi:hypothetical protein
VQIGNYHSTHATLRERIVEHVFVGDVLRRLWQQGILDVEVLRSEFDAGGYDLVLSYRTVMRHVQLKTMMENGKAARTKVSLKLMEKPSGCVIWIILSPKLELKSYLWFGNSPGKPLPDIRNMKVAKHTKGNAEGIKGERPNLRILPRSHFEPVDSLDSLLCKLFGKLH